MDKIGICGEVSYYFSKVKSGILPYNVLLL